VAFKNKADKKVDGKCWVRYLRIFIQLTNTGKIMIVIIIIIIIRNSKEKFEDDLTLYLAHYENCNSVA